MRKIISVVLMAAILLGILCISASAEENHNLLPDCDSTFESGTTSWTVFSGGALEIVDNPDGEGKVLKYQVDTTLFESNGNTWQSFALDIKPLLTANVTEDCTVFISMDVYSDGGFSIPVTLRSKKEHLSFAEESNSEYPRLGNVRGDSEWVTFNGRFELTEDDLKVQEGSWTLCFDGLPKVREDITVYIDNVYVGIEEPDIAEKAEIPEAKPISQQENLLVGAIRWDAYFSTDDRTSDVSRQVAKALSPKEFHWHAPFFSKFDAEGNVSFPEYTEELWIKEAEYAKQAGLDYFAYLWYDTNDPMSQPRKTHLKSSKKNSIQMCAILETIRPEETMDELYEAMLSSCYVKLDGRPVVFLYQYHTKWTPEMLKKLRQGAADAGVEEALYIVGMISSSDDIMASVLKNDGVEAFSWYAVGPSEAGGTPYTEVAAKGLDKTQSLGSVAGAYGFSVIPSVTTGYDTRPRIKNPVTWIDGDPTSPNEWEWPYGNRYTLDAAASDIGAHLKDTLEYVKNNSQNTKANMVLSYAWNEHDEGGWICPTVKCDADGNVLYNEDGTAQVDTSRIEAFKNVIAEYKSVSSGNSTVVSPTPDVNITPEATEQVEKIQGDNTVLFVGCGIGAAVLVIAAVTVIVIVKRKAKDAKNS